jgi:hypothetical protein
MNAILIRTRDLTISLEAIALFQLSYGVFDTTTKAART